MKISFLQFLILNIFLDNYKLRVGEANDKISCLF